VSTTARPIAPAQPAAPARIGKRLATALVSSSYLNPLNTTLISVALVPIGETFGAGPARTAWLVTALYLVSAVGQPVMGLFVDRFGARRVLIIGMSAVIVAGIAGMLAISLEWLVGVRVLLGMGTCAGFPAAMAALRAHTDATGQGVPGRLLSVLAISNQTVMVLGPPLGGALIALFGWPAIFAVNVPLAAAALLFTVLWVPRDDRRRDTRQPVDVAGILLFSVAIVVLLLFVMDPQWRKAYLLAVFAVVASVFTWVELRVGRPFVDVRKLATNGPLLRTYLRQALALLIVYAIMFGYVQWLESVRGLSPSAAGALLLPMSVVAVLAAAFSSNPHTVRARLITNSLALAAGSALLLFLGAGTWILALVGLGAIFGVGQGLSSVTNQTALYSQAPAEDMGTASGLFRTAQYVGALAASALIARSFGHEPSTAGLHTLGWALLAIALVLLALTVFDRSLKRFRRYSAIQDTATK